MLKFYFLICFYTIVSIQSYAQSQDAPANTRFYYDGFLDKNQHVQLNLHIEDYDVNGAFVIEATGDHYFIQGRLSADKSGLGLWVYKGTEYVAAIEARVISTDKEFGKTLRGIYKPHEKSTQQLIFKKIAEFANNGKLGKQMIIKII